jgi:curli biogenesis system outer membrane secretion channel CsgG
MRPGVFALVLAALLAAAPAAQSKRPSVAVLDFDYGTLHKWWEGNHDIGSGISDMIVDELVNDGTYRVIERKRLDAILAEQNFANSDRADPSAQSLAKIGKVLGIKYFIVGSVTKFGTEQSRKSVGGGAFGGAFGVGKVGTSKGKANVAITARMIDASTAEILVSAKGEGTSKRSGLLLAGGAGGRGGAGIGELDFGSSDFRDTILGEATEIAVKETTAKLIAGRSRLED